MDILDTIPDYVFDDEECIVCEDSISQDNFIRLEGLTFYHMNICSLRSNFDELSVFLNNYLDKIDIIFLSETWYESSAPYTFSLPGFESAFTEYNFNQNSGLCVFVKSYLNFHVTELKLTMTNCLRLDMKFNNLELCVLGIYRSPSSNVSLFLEEFNTVLSDLASVPHCLIIGDININTLLNCRLQNLRDDYLDLISEHGFVQCITKPTRITSSTISCIDHTLYKHADITNIKTAVFTTSINDHYSNVTKILNMNTLQQSRIHSISNTFKYIDYNILNNKLSEETWFDILSNNDVDDATSCFVQKFQNYISESTIKKKN